MNDRSYDIVVFGATSFVGQILCTYLSNCADNESFKWAIAGRSQSKLDLVNANFEKQSKKVATIIADADDEQALIALCNQTRVVISTVGPYALYGETLVRVCAQTGTDYCDLTGEPQWIKRMINLYEDEALRTGARIVPSCGFDSIPSDLGVYYLQWQEKEKFGQHCNNIRMGVKSMKGTFSGGTVASMINGAKEAVANKAVRKELSDPYSLCPRNHEFSTRQHNIKLDYDKDFKSWVTAFIMAIINIRIVHRSNALSGNAYGLDFKYSEGTLTGDGSKGKRRARILGFGQNFLMFLLVLPPTRWLLQLSVLPKPGQGPSPKAQQEGYYELQFIGTTASGEIIRTNVTGDRDPGYGSTSKMLGQVGLCLAFDIKKDDCKGGFWTPATIFGEQLITRLRTRAGITFKSD